ncbi:hypothetical protein ECANGB1_722 [Enterospora canceri]|uniref:Uncharacterized protein n=1 Tax=Enterospora canceri TaxID=1081671 RepID=A0A1Y1S498_9MICR|nr:hypothetical protein ECANGB1_722 [Enterospora canceri]
MLFLSLFNKIEFVQEDFENLSNNKVEKTSFYESIAKMKRQLKNISLSLETNFEKKMVLEIYALFILIRIFITLTV